MIPPHTEAVAGGNGHINRKGPAGTMWDRRADVERVKDGDTLVVVLDQGFGDTKTIDLRLGGVFAPDRKDAGYQETREFVAGWLLDHGGADRLMPHGRWPWVVTTARKPKADAEQTTLGRIVGYLTTPDGTESLNEAINAFVAQHNYPHGVGG